MPLQAIIMTDANTYDVLIIGGGPAAFTAALFLAQANYKVGYIEKNVPGGKLINIQKITNYPGCKEINGADLALSMYEQVDALGVDSIYGEVTLLDRYNDYHVIYTNDGKTRYTKVLIFATGTSLNKLEAINADKYVNKGISQCATCDGPLTKNKEVCVIGSDLGAASNALYLSKLASKVYIINPKQKMNINDEMLNNIARHQNIEIINDTSITEVLGNEVVTGAKLSNGNTIDVSFIFVYIGTTPNTKLLKNYNVLDEKGFVIVNENMETSTPGLYAVGDVTNQPVKLITVAVGQATIAAINAIKFMNNKK